MDKGHSAFYAAHVSIKPYIEFFIHGILNLSDSRIIRDNFLMDKKLNQNDKYFYI